MRIRPYIICLQMVLICVIFKLTAKETTQNKILLTEQTTKINLTSDLVAGWLDTANVIPDSAVKLYNKGLFTSIYSENNIDNAGNTSAFYWMALDIENQSEIYDWYLEMHDPHLGSATVYELEKGKLKEIGISGYYLPFRKRMIQHKNHFFLFSISPGKEKTLFVKIHSSTFASLNASIVRSSQMISYSLKEYWFLGLYYGALIILIIYNTVLFLQTKQKPFLWYSIFVTACLLSAFREDGLGFQFLWPAFPQFNFYLFDISTIFTLWSFSWFSISFLEISKKKTAAFKIIFCLAIAYTVIHFSEAFLVQSWDFSSFIYPVPYILIYFTAFSSAWRNDQPALHFITGFSCFVIGVICFFLRNFGLLPNTIFTIYIMNFSVLFEVIIMSYALGTRYRQQQELLRISQDQELNLLKEKAGLDARIIFELAEQDRLKQSINEELEKKVIERTSELYAKNKELEDANKQLSFYKERLETDWVKLDKERWELSKQVNDHILDKIKGNETSYEEFIKIFPTNDACLIYLSELKWANGFVCKQCGNHKFLKGELPFSRKCTKCTHRETVTAGTLFHGIKIDLTKAFYITHLSLFGSGTTTIKELAERLDLRTATCWNFKKKVENSLSGNSIKSSWENIILQPGPAWSGKEVK